MVSCGHQMCSSDDTDWFLSSSAAAPIGGTSNTTFILNSLLEEDSSDDQDENNSFLSNNGEPSFLQSRGIRLAVAKDREVKLRNHRDGRLSQSRVKVQSFHDFSEFDEAEHLDGCPVKWLFRRQSSESVRSCGPSLGRSTKSAEGIRDKIPREINIRKMGLKKRQSRRKQNHQKRNHSVETEGSDNLAIRALSSEEEWKILANKEERRAKLAAKVNFRPFDENQDEDENDEPRCQSPMIVVAGTAYKQRSPDLVGRKWNRPTSRSGSRSAGSKSVLSNFLPSRPLHGLRPWLCVLLAPRLDNCCAVSEHRSLGGNKGRSRSPSITIHSLSLPQLAKTSSHKRPRATQAARWAGHRKPKPVIEVKTYQAPPQLTIKLRGEVASPPSPPHLLIEDRMFPLRRFLNLGGTNVDKVILRKVENVSSAVGPETTRAPKTVQKTKGQFRNEMEVVCNKAQFFSRPGKPMR